MSENVIFIIVIIALFMFSKFKSLFDFGKITERTSEAVFGKTTTNTPRQIYNSLTSLSDQARKIVVAHAMAESFNGAVCRSKDFNYWNFGEPSRSWWKSSPVSRGTGLTIRTDDVGRTIAFSSLAKAQAAFIQILKHGRPSAYRSITSSYPRLAPYLASLCPAEYGARGAKYATACSSTPDTASDYTNSITFYYDRIESYL